MKQINLIVLALLLFCNAAFSQKIIKEEGDLSFLKGQKALKVEYTYDNMGVGKFDKEEDYVNEKVTSYEENEKGKGEKWKNGWLSARKNLYQPKFEELLNKNLEDIDMVALPSKADAKYTLILHTTFTEPGWNVGVMRKSASVNVEYIFVETANPSKVVAKFLAKGIPGRDVSGYDFDAGERISEGYAKAGKMLGKYMRKALSK